MTHPTIEVRPLAAAVGAEVRGVDLARLDERARRQVYAALVDRGVLVFRDQELSPRAQIDLALRFGKPEQHPIVNGVAEYPELIRVHKPAGESASFGTGWHSDNSFMECPSLGSILYAVTVPPFGGDTLYASAERAYDGLSPRMRDMLEGLVAIHSARRAYDPAVTGEAKYRGDAPITYRESDAIRAEVEHPVVRTHPDSRRKGLYVNPMFTLRICGLEAGESAALLGFLYAHCRRPEFTCRVRWEPGTVAFWDNRSVQHYALDDYRDYERVMHRVTIAGDRPV